jgi:hypothetical protein
MSDKYPDSTLDVKFKSIEDKLDEHFEATTGILNDVVRQTTKTNGSVRNLQLWRQFILGGFAVFSMFVIPIMSFLAYQVFQNSQHIAGIDSVITQILAKP